MQNIQFFVDPKSYNPKSDAIFIAHLPKIESEEQLFNELNFKLKFPPYFGFNWNAIYDCLTDFSWIEQKK